MEFDLVKEQWHKGDIKSFENYLLSFAKPDKVAWTQKIINTKQQVLAIPTPTLRDFAKKIRQGNYRSFLDLGIFSTYESTVLYGIIMSQSTDLDLWQKYLAIYAAHIDSWAHCDLLTFKVKNHESEFLALSQRLVKSEKLFVRRIGVVILFKLVDPNYLPAVFEIIRSLAGEDEYYVNMAVAWLLCDCFIKQREQTLAFLQTHNLPAMVINKFVSKCRDSYRVSAADKAMLRRQFVSKDL